MSYESWRATFQSSEQAARKTYQQVDTLTFERDVLAAYQVDLVRELAACQAVLHNLAHDRQATPDYANDAKAVLKREPITSLALRDAALKATGIRESVDHILSTGSQTHLGILRHDRYMYISTRELREHADALFQKAEAQQ